LQQSHDELAALLRRIFGRTSERYMGDTAGQLLLAFDSEDDIEDARAGILQALEEHREQTEAKKKRRKRRGTSELFPEHLPRQEIIVDLDDDEKEGLQRIGEDVTETLHFRRPVLHVLSASAELIRPFIDYLSDVVRTDPCLGTDDTGVCLLLPDAIPAIDPDDRKSKRVHEVIRHALATKKKSLTAKMWVYRGMSIPLSIFDFTVSRHRDGYPLRSVPSGPVSDRQRLRRDFDRRLLRREHRHHDAFERLDRACGLQCAGTDTSRL
jgi:hypothetical protein